MRQTIAALGVTVAVMLPLSACSSISEVAHTAVAQGDPTQTHNLTHTPTPTPTPTVAEGPLGKDLVGYSTPGFPHSLAPFKQLAKQTGIPADIASWYTPMSQDFDSAEVEKIKAQGALPLIEIDSDNIPLTQVAAGEWDQHFIAYARAVAAYHSPIAIDFDHEFNDPSNEWDYQHNSPAAFVSAWRRIVWLFRKNGATNVIWIWNPGTDLGGTAPIGPWYPGNQYVTYVGLDGYFLHPADTFATVFDKTLSQLSAFTSKQVLIVETGANPGQERVTQINSLFAGLEATPQIVGFIWFDYNKYTGHDWVLEGDKAALKAFHADARKYQADNQNLGQGAARQAPEAGTTTASGS